MSDETKLCPFKKDTVYETGYNSGAGYPVSWHSSEHLGLCEGDKCMCYATTDKGTGFCGLIKCVAIK